MTFDKDTKRMGSSKPLDVEYYPTVMEVFMKRRQINQKMVGEVIGKDQAIVSYILNNQRMLSEEQETKIAKLLGIVKPKILLTPFDPNVIYETTQDDAGYSRT